MMSYLSVAQKYISGQSLHTCSEALTVEGKVLRLTLFDGVQWSPLDTVIELTVKR